MSGIDFFLGCGSSIRALSHHRRATPPPSTCRGIPAERKTLGQWSRPVGSELPDLEEDINSITATLETPLGLLLAENTKDRCVYIESIEPHSHADTSGVLKPGDILVACSAIAMQTRGSLYNRNSRGRKGGCCSTGCADCPFTLSNWKSIVFDCRGKSFDAVIAALSSNNARWVRRNTPTTITLTVSRGT